MTLPQYKPGRISPSIYPKIAECLKTNTVHYGAILIQIYNENQVGERLCSTCPDSIMVARLTFQNILEDAGYYDSQSQ